MNAGRRSILIAIVIGAASGGALVNYWYRAQGVVTTGAQGTTLETLQADVERLKSLVPSQSHAMGDVADHWTNLWFAAKEGNWPLARFFFSEARQYVRWTVLIRPVRKAPDGSDVNVKGIWDAIEPSTFAAVDLAIEQEEFAVFEQEYRAATETCYACHKAAGLPFLRPMIPTTPHGAILNFATDAEWPR